VGLVLFSSCTGEDNRKKCIITIALRESLHTIEVQAKTTRLRAHYRGENNNGDYQFVFCGTATDVDAAIGNFESEAEQLSGILSRGFETKEPENGLRA